MKRKVVVILGIVALVIVSFYIFGLMRKKRVEATFQGYVAYLKSAYELMDKNYYAPVDRGLFDSFLQEFRTRIFDKQVRDKSQVDNGIKHIATGILVARLKNPADPFTNFYPPQLVRDLKQSALGFTMGDIGLEGYVRDGTFIITQVEPRSDAAKKEIAIGDAVLKIEGKPVAELTEDAIKKIFTPPVGQEVGLDLFSATKNAAYAARLTSLQYFKQSVFAVPTANPQVACLKIKFFNEETGNEMRSLVDSLNRATISKLVIDLRDNGGGPPLAAWDIAGIFIGPQQRLFYFQRRDTAPMGLVSQPSPVLYQGQVVILTNRGTGSASELFAGIMQAYSRARLVGANSAGQVYLKSLFDLSDGATLELTVARGYLFTGQPIDPEGLKPDVTMDTGDSLLNNAVAMMVQ